MREWRKCLRAKGWHAHLPQHRGAFLLAVLLARPVLLAGRGARGQGEVVEEEEALQKDVAPEVVVLHLRHPTRQGRRWYQAD